ncbi:MAG: bifunctional 2-polyprenyl-6-hydroxyphenol methylase/3-demethylubiquinol 3-O-methyltransferase UbiG [Gammaproteobacteria bacterium]|nr:bifunctional 2-polyprenyl-6-hydroxyphenol methylase/3-demethylubiquinol 3-O-methyltransferase UbiG [Gammaproteobacteria bacterium]
MTQTSQNSDPAEVAKFEALAAEWWNLDGPLRTLHEINPLRLSYIEERVTIKGARILDVGCGGGLLSEALAARDADVVGIDLAGASLEVARRHAADSETDVEYRQIEAARLAEEQPGQFDIVTCLELLEHVPDPEALVAACSLAVRPGGSVFFSTINRNLTSFLLAIIGAEHVLRMVPRGTHEYLKLVRPAELAGWCRRADLDLRDITGLHFNPLTRSYRLGGNSAVNYFAYTVR